MTTDFQTDDSFTNSNADNIDIGKKLKAARIARHLDERQVATELKIPIDQVRALENNDFSYFRSLTFARGYLKSYCRLLALDTQEAMADFAVLTGAAGKESNIKPVDKVINKQAGFGDPFVILVSVVIVAVLIFLAFWWPTFSTNNSAIIQKESSSQAETSVTDQQDEEPVLSASTTQNDDETEADQTTPDDASSDALPAGDTQVTGNSAIDSQATDNQQAVTAITDNAGVTTGLSAETIAILKKAGVSPEKVEAATQEVPEVTQQSVPDEPKYDNDIEVAFDADCWTEVRDSTGKILFSGVKTAGSKLELTGTAPYRVVLGYARGVSSFEFKGEAFDFSSYTHKDLARFELK